MSQSIEALVNQQIRRWELARRSSISVPPLPCVVLSRLPGAGAAELGRRVAEQLGYPFFDRELVEWIARRSGHRAQLVADLDEHIRNTIDRFVTDGFARERFTEGDFLHHLVQVLATLGERGGAVILGRGAQFIVPPAHALRVLVVAPHADRVEFLRKERAISTQEAESQIRQADANRREFLRHHFRRDPDDPVNYDLCVNTGSFSLQASASLLIAAYRARFPDSKR